MDLLTIGAFSALTRLSPKALRLYAELGLLPAARVDPVTGYRFYAPAQRERAQLVAWLRRIGMPLARIRDVCDLEGPAAAEAVSRFWAQVEIETAARRDLAGFLVAQLAADRPEPAASVTSGDRHHGRTPPPGPRLAVRYAVRSDTGLVRPGNQDAAYAGTGLLAVADGFGPGGDRAGAAAIDALRSVSLDPGTSAAALLNALQDAVARANHAIGELGASHPGRSEEPDGPRDGVPAGTTLTALLWTGSRMALVHIGDSRAYLRRDGQLFQVTHDHTLVQAMVDDGRLTAAEAASHPQRTMLVRALDGRAGPAAEVRLHEARAGDRYLLCSDGLSAVAAAEDLAAVVAAGADPEQTVRDLIALARTAGAPDNVSCVIADVTAPEPAPAGC